MSNRDTSVRSRFFKRDRQAKAPVGASLTQQHFAKEVDINAKVDRFIKTGQFGPVGTRQPFYGDFTSMEYMDMQNKVADIDQMFAALPAKLRKRFNHSAYQMVRFIENPANTDEAVKLGLLAGKSVEVDPNQIDLVKESEKGPSQAQQAATTAAKADPEAQPPPPRKTS